MDNKNMNLNEPEREIESEHGSGAEIGNLREPLIQTSPPIAPQEPYKHSGLGIASFIIAIFSMILSIVSLVTTAVLGKDIFQNLADQGILYGRELINSEQMSEIIPVLVVAGLLFAGVAILSLIGGILGIVGLFQKNRKKLYSIIGTVMNLLGWLVFLLLLVIGLIL